MESDGNPFTAFLLFPKGSRIAGADESAALGLMRREHGMLLCVDGDGGRWTLLGDAEYLRTLDVAPDWVSSDLVIPAGKFPDRRRGWPEDWSEDGAAAR